MMQLTQMIAAVIVREGGYIHHPTDKGGPTKYGITLRTLESWRGTRLRTQDVQLLTREEAVEIYAARYYYGAKLERLPECLQPAMFDACVNHGARNAWKLLQQAVNALGFVQLVEDGIPGEKTFAAVAEICRHNAPEPLREFVQQRRFFLNASPLPILLSACS